MKLNENIIELLNHNKNIKSLWISENGNHWHTKETKGFIEFDRAKLLKSNVADAVDNTETKATTPDVKPSKKTK